MRSYFPGGSLNALASPPRGSILRRAREHRLGQWTTGVSNPIRYPRFRVSASGVRQSVAFAFGVPHDINGFHPYTMSSTDLSHPLVLPFLLHLLGWAQGFHKRLTKPPTHPLRPVNPGNAWGTRITAPAGTSLGTPYSSSTVNNLLP